MDKVYVVNKLELRVFRDGTPYWGYGRPEGIYSNEEAAKQQVQELTWEAEENCLDLKYEVEERNVSHKYRWE